METSLPAILLDGDGQTSARISQRRRGGLIEWNMLRSRVFFFCRVALRKPGKKVLKDDVETVMARWAEKVCTDVTNYELGKGEQTGVVSRSCKGSMSTWRCAQRVSALEVTVNEGYRGVVFVEKKRAGAIVQWDKICAVLHIFFYFFLDIWKV